MKLFTPRNQTSIHRAWYIWYQTKEIPKKEMNALSYVLRITPEISTIKNLNIFIC